MNDDLAKMKNDEWLEADGLGGFASGTVPGLEQALPRLLLTATKPPSGRVVLVMDSTRGSNGRRNFSSRLSYTTRMSCIRTALEE